MSAGGTVLMIHEGDTKPFPVPKNRVAWALANGFKWHNRPPIVGALDAAPTTMAIGGSLVGGPLATAGAAATPGLQPTLPAAPFAGRMAGGVAGGTLGKLIQEGGYRALGYGDAPGTVADEAQAQAMYGLVGEVPGKALGLAGRGVMKTGIGQKGAEAALAVRDMISRRVPIGGFDLPGAASRVPYIGDKLARAAEGAASLPVIGPLFKRGGAEAAKNMEAATIERNAVNSAAGRAGQTVPRSVAEDPIRDLIQQAQEASLDKDARTRYMIRRLRGIASNPERLSPRAAEMIRKEADDALAASYTKRNAGKNASPKTIKEKWLRGVADNLRKYMHENIPGHEAASKKLSGSIATSNAVRKAEHEGLGRLGARFGVGAGIGATADYVMHPEKSWHSAHSPSAITGAALLSSPAALSRASLLMTDPALLALLRQTPRFAAGSRSGQ